MFLSAIATGIMKVGNRDKTSELGGYGCEYGLRVKLCTGWFFPLKPSTRDFLMENVWRHTFWPLSMLDFLQEQNQKNQCLCNWDPIW